MSIKKGNAVFLGLGFALLSYTNASALTQQELNNYVLESYAERYEGSSRLEAYLKRNGVDMNEYKQYVKELNAYKNSSEYTWEKIENGSILIDEMLFSDTKVKKEYEKALEKLGSDRLAYEFVKKNMMNDSERFISRFESQIKSMKKIRSAFVDKFDREMTNLEEVWLSDPDTVRHAFYAGVNGGILVPSEALINMENLVDVVENGGGYRVLELSEKDIEKYKSFIKKRDNYDTILINYAKSCAMFDSIYNEILSKYNKDIFKELSDKERLNIYNESVKGFVFNEENAKKKIIKILISKNVISKDDLVDEDKDGINFKDTSNTNPWVELNKYLKDNPTLNTNVQSLSSFYEGTGFTTIFEDLADKFIYAKYKDEDINTYLRITNDNIVNGAMFGDLLNILESSVDLRTIFSKKEMLTYFENKISTFKLAVDDETKIEFKKMVDMFKSIGIELYLKDIDYSEDEAGEVQEVESNTESKDGQVNYKMNINFDDKMAVYSLGENDAIQFENLEEIMDLFGAKCVVSSDSVLIYKDNKIIISKAFGLEDKEISTSKFKALLEDINVKVNIQVIKEIV